ncbi:MAG: septal ring lytic transglycosylase RlpA family protein [Armatimonadetes bacterium]|nr:septal ring lytic transglycosylase RlpA family protein [Armatimonadota bacterium]
MHQFYGNSQTEVIQKDVIKGDVFYFITSYYGTKFHGRPTSNGEVFDMNKLTCAHKTLPFNTILKVTNEDNGKSVVVRVNDRGPFIKGRDLDLSFAAAKEIGLIGVGVKQLQVEILESPKSE